MNITFVASESNPFIKTGGLADVVYSLAKEFVNENNKVSVIIPFYGKVKTSLKMNVDYLGEFKVQLNWRKIPTKVCHATVDGIEFYFIENDYYFWRNNIYGEWDDGERFAYFSVASLAVIKKFKLKPKIIHVHDWQPAMIPCLIKEHKDPYFKNTKTVLTIHNPAFQGFFPRDFILDVYSLNSECYDNGNIKMFDAVSTLKAGVVYADKITTVSPTHREEILSPEGGKGLDGVFQLRKDDFIGILNGIDYEEFNPEKDKLIKHTFNIKNFGKYKEINKQSLLKHFNLTNKDQPVFGLVSRLTWQKGINLVVSGIEELVKRGANFVILGSGEYALEQEFERLRRQYPNQIGIYIGYNDELAHQIYAGSDFFMMPSLFEPCGLSQMISQRYGTLPIVRLTGGLKDSVICFDNNNVDSANGFGFLENSVYEFNRTLSFAYDNYWNLPIRRSLIVNAMTTDNSWKTSAQKYLDLYKEMK